MADFYTYRREMNGRRRRRRGALMLALLLALVCVGAGLFWFYRDAEEADAPAQTPPPAETATAETAPTPTPSPTPVPVGEDPQRILPAVDNAAWDTAVPVEPTIDLEYLNTDSRMAALPAQGTVTQSYFDTVTFVGDSITSGLGIYETGVPNAKYCAYIGAGPNSFVNNVTTENAVTHVSEAVFDAVVATQPDYVYIMLGTNSLVQQGNEESFIAYYERLIDLLREQLHPEVIYYIQAIPAVQEYVVETKPGLDNARIRTVNDLLANMALRKGCYFINPPEVLNQADGSQVDEYATADGIHLQPSGYRAWADYIATHTAWNRRTIYLGQNPLKIFGA